MEHGSATQRDVFLMPHVQGSRLSITISSRGFRCTSAIALGQKSRQIGLHVVSPDQLKQVLHEDCPTGVSDFRATRVGAPIAVRSVRVAVTWVVSCGTACNLSKNSGVAYPSTGILR